MRWRIRGRKFSLKRLELGLLNHRHQKHKQFGWLSPHSLQLLLGFLRVGNLRLCQFSYLPRSQQLLQKMVQAAGVISIWLLAAGRETSSGGFTCQLKGTRRSTCY